MKIFTCWPKSCQLDWWMQIPITSTISRGTETCAGPLPEQGFCKMEFSTKICFCWNLYKKSSPKYVIFPISCQLLSNDDKIYNTMWLRKEALGIPQVCQIFFKCIYFILFYYEDTDNTKCRRLWYISFENDYYKIEIEITCIQCTVVLSKWFCTRTLPRQKTQDHQTLNKPLHLLCFLLMSIDCVIIM